MYDFAQTSKTISEKATAELEALINDIKVNPNRYVHFSIFGKNTSKN